jgi:hypothetical protein
MSVTQDSARELLQSIKSDATVSPAIKSKADDLAKMILPAYTYDLWIYRIVVAILGIVVIGTVAGGLFLSFKGDPNFKLPSEIVAIGSAAVGALAGLLAPAPSQRT